MICSICCRFSTIKFNCWKHVTFIIDIVSVISWKMLPNVTNILIIVINIILCAYVTYGFKSRESRSFNFNLMGVEGKLFINIINWKINKLFIYLFIYLFLVVGWFFFLLLDNRYFMLNKHTIKRIENVSESSCLLNWVCFGSRYLKATFCQHYSLYKPSTYSP
jgi:hypothetical protein